MPAHVYLSLGSNLGDRAGNLRSALLQLPAAGVSVDKVSSFWETEPVDVRDQPWFLNCAVEGRTGLEPVDLLRALRDIELRMGSRKEFAKGPRLLDIDILLYGDLVLATPELQIPHPRMLQRRFVLAPLAEIAPLLRHPGWPGTASELLLAILDPSEVRKSQPGP